MSVDLKDLETTPTLSLDPFGEAEKEPEVPAAPAPEAVKPAFDESILNDDERKMVDSFAKQIDLTNNNMILQYGAGAQKKMADFSEAALENVRTKDLGEVGDMLSSVVTELKSFDAGRGAGKRLLRLFSKRTPQAGHHEKQVRTRPGGKWSLKDRKAPQNHQVVL